MAAVRRAFRHRSAGLVGLKASRGRVPQPLSRNEYVTRISIDGVVSRTVRDTAAVYDYLSRVPNGGSFIKMGAPDRFVS